MARRLYQYGRSCRNITIRKDVESALTFCSSITLDRVRAGDLVLFAMSGRFSNHVAVISSIDPINIIHAYAVVGRVVENIMDHYWHSKILSCFRLDFDAVSHDAN